MIAALHQNPEEVLEIGLSSGSWARVIANHTGVRRLTVVEINPGYIEVVRKYPNIATILHDPKVTLHIDDGRRWLNRNPDAKFDLIVMNTTLYWRDGATNLLSDEFLRLCKSHLKHGGVVYYNTTSSKDVSFTAAHVFKHVMFYSTFIAASDSPFTMSKEEKHRSLLKFRNTGVAALSKDTLGFQRLLERLAASDLSDKSEEIRRKQGLWHITDDNMATEFKTKNRWFDPHSTWANLFKTF
jgi:spermidine synthase